jgi:murein DD-endopeptidase MepM/ murein hydrolase activator NlpD
MDRMLRVNTRTTLGFLAAGAIAATVLGARFLIARHTEPAPSTPPAAQAQPAAPPAPKLIAEELPIQRGDTLEGVLVRANIDKPLRFEMMDAIAKAFDVRKFRAGAHLTLYRDPSGAIDSLEYVIDPDHMLQLLRTSGTSEAAVVEIPGVVREAPVCATLEGSLFETMDKAGEGPELAIRMADIFAYDIDFYQDPRPGDKFCILVEKKEYANGQPATYRRILAANYDNAGTMYDAFLFPDEDGKEVYYSGSGESLQAAFLRSPLAFDARVSSHFSMHRLHPILGVYRPHLGTDYAAPTGTPVLAVADGRVEFSGYSGGSGNLITLRHSNGYQTQYLHLSRRLVRAGQKVEQGQRIGLVGATGLATGSHLDMRISKNGAYLDWERLKLPRSVRIGADRKSAFEAERDRLEAMLESGSRPVLAGAPADAGEPEAGQ